MVIFVQLFLTFVKIGLFAFGGGFATLPLIEREIVTVLQWFSHSEFLELIAISELTPGPIAINAATFVGYKLGGVWGSAVATIGVCLPSATLILVVAYFLHRFEGNIWADRIVRSLRPAVIALIAAAVYSVAGKGITDIWGIVIAVAAFAVLRTRKVNPVLVLIIAGIAGIIIYL
jgi:chromate transporter